MFNSRTTYHSIATPVIKRSWEMFHFLGISMGKSSLAKWRDPESMDEKGDPIWQKPIRLPIQKPHSTLHVAP
jgi:hypothetical protein